MIDWVDFERYEDIERWRDVIEKTFGEYREPSEEYKIKNFLWDYMKEWLFEIYAEPLAQAYADGCEYDEKEGRCFPFVKGMSKDEARRAYFEKWPTLEDVAETVRDVLESFLISFNPHSFRTLEETLNYVMDRIKEELSREVDMVLKGEYSCK